MPSPSVVEPQYQQRTRVLRSVANPEEVAALFHASDRMREKTLERRITRNFVEMLGDRSAEDILAEQRALDEEGRAFEKKWNLAPEGV